ncbi:MAG: hypothetical protein IJY28_02365 [Clostridia bacterium]|nr:hypothetical protein [Clostridia bacterium]
MDLSDLKNIDLKNFDMDKIKDIIEGLVDKIKDNKELLEKFKDEPVKVIEELLNIDLPDEMLEKVVDGVKAKINLDQIGDMLESFGGLGKLGKLFGRK